MPCGVPFMRETQRPGQIRVSISLKRVYHITEPMKKARLSRHSRLSIRFCDLCGTRLVGANTSRRHKQRCSVCATTRGRREAETALRRQTQIISGFKPPSFWKNSDN